MWPADALWELSERALTLGVIALVWALARRQAGARLLPHSPSVALRPAAKPTVYVLGAAALFTLWGWASQASHLGVAQTLAMALGGPTVEEIKLCRSQISARLVDGFPLMCPYGGTISR